MRHMRCRTALDSTNKCPSLKRCMSLIQIKAPPTENAQKFNPHLLGKAFSETEESLVGGIVPRSNLYTSTGPRAESGSTPCQSFITTYPEVAAARWCATSRACSSPLRSLSAASRLQSIIGPVSSWPRGLALHATSICSVAFATATPGNASAWAVSTAGGDEVSSGSQSEQAHSGLRTRSEVVSRRVHGVRAD